jgi:hypothetical protein
LAVTRQVDQNEPRLGSQNRDLLAPETEVAGPAMDEKDGVFAFPGRDVVHFVRAEEGKVRLAQSLRIRRRHLGEGTDDGKQQRGGRSYERACGDRKQKGDFVYSESTAPEKPLSTSRLARLSQISSHFDFFREPIARIARIPEG